MITIVPYDPEWPHMFETEATRLRSTFGDLARRIEHVGSTAVPGLPAKPVIDIQVSVQSLEKMDIYRRLLESLGYVHIPLGEFDRVYPFFQEPAGWPSTHHVHLCVEGGGLEARHIDFRDHLRSNPEVAANYVLLKQELASRYAGDTLESRESYSLGKSAFVKSVLERA